MRLRDIFAFVALSGMRLSHRYLRPPSGAFRILLFHDVPDSQQKAFAALMAEISSMGGFISPAEAMSRLMTDAPAGNNRVPCLVSFDDGFASN